MCFESPVLWLAIIIVRSCSDWTRLLDRLITSKMLGELDKNLVNKQQLKFEVDLSEAEVEVWWGTP